MFPLKFCQQWWEEDLDVTERAVLIRPDVVKFIDRYKGLPESKVPNSASLPLVKEQTSNPLHVAKLEYFASVARQLKPFLTMFQTDAPMVPFLSEELKEVVTSLLTHSVKTGGPGESKHGF